MTGPRWYRMGAPELMMLLAAVLMMAPGCSKKEQRGQSAPNVIIIVIDAASAPYFGCYGDKSGTSPNIDAFAQEGVVFENAYSQTPTTVSSTSSLMTGVRATTHQMTDQTVLATDLQTLPEALSDQGMTCYGVIGNPFAGAPATGLDRGYVECVQVYALPSLQQDRGIEETSKFRVTLPEDINGEAFKLLDKFGQSGSFAYVHYLQPHKPYTPPESRLKKFNCHLTDWKSLHDGWAVANRTGSADEGTIRGLEARYRANINYVDEAIGELFAKLKKDDRYDESLIVVMSDHGEAFFKHKFFGHNATLYDDMTRIPMIMKFPKSAGVRPSRIANPVETIDVFPTIFDYLKLPAPAQLEGDSLWGLITGDQKELPGPEVITCTIQRSRHALRVRDFKYIFNRGLVEELYDLRHDPDEQHNLARKMPDSARRMRDMLMAVIDVNTGRAVAGKSKLRDDPQMDALVKTLGYGGGGIDDEYQHQPDANDGDDSATQPAASQPATTQPSALDRRTEAADHDC